MRWLYRQARFIISKFPSGRRALAWTDPWHLTRQAIVSEIRAHSHYAHGRILDLGCGDQHYRESFSRLGNYMSLDLPPERSGAFLMGCPLKPTVYGNGLELPFRDSTFDTVLSFSVLEVMSEPGRCVSEISRVLNPGGVLIVQTWVAWGCPEASELRRFTSHGLRDLAEGNGLVVEALTPLTGVWGTLAQRASHYLFSGSVSENMRGWMVVPMGVVAFAASVIDKAFGKQGDTIGYLMVARKLPKGS
jgi:SAM-dependent methyltransferase